MPSCDFIQECLARDGPSRMQADAAVRNHVQGCIHCTGFLAAITRLEETSGQLPNHDAPDQLVLETAEMIAGSAKADRLEQADYRQNRRWATGFATAAVVLASVGLTQNLSQFIPSGFSIAGMQAGAPSEWVDRSNDQVLTRTSAHAPETPQEEMATLDAAEPKSMEALPPPLVETVLPEVESEVDGWRERVSGQTLHQAQSPHPDGRTGTESGKTMLGPKLNRLDRTSSPRRSQPEKLGGVIPRDKEVPMQTERWEKEIVVAEPSPVAPTTQAEGKGRSDVNRQEFEVAGSLDDDRFEAPPGGFDRDESRVSADVLPFADAPADLAVGAVGRSGETGLRLENGLTKPRPRALSAKDRIAGAKAISRGADDFRQAHSEIGFYGEDPPLRPNAPKIKSALAQDETGAGELRGRSGMEKRKTAKQRVRREETVKNSVSNEPYIDKHERNELSRSRVSATPGRESKPVSTMEVKTRVPAESRIQSRPPVAKPTNPRGIVSEAIQGDTDLDQARRAARRFLNGRTNVNGLSFREASGYWANTYIPGDPYMRLLGTRLRAWDRRTLPSAPRMEQAARPNWQPFDSPRNSALSLYLNSDRSAIEAPSRMLVQVGLKGSLRQSGRRPAMNVGLVVDLHSGMEPELGAKVRALISGLEKARQPGDRFSLTLAGRSGGLFVPPEQFRHGTLRVVMDGIFTGEEKVRGHSLGLVQAVAQAMEIVRKGDDPTATLGSSLVLVVSTSSVTPHLAELEHLAHSGAVRGIALSMVPLGMRTDLDAIDRLVAAGQGNRRILGTAAEASALMDRELYASSAVVARAVRLRIRLAPGVRLVDVLGSHRLEERQARQVREAEQSIDRRIARNLGIRADRGKDEEGIQIVIPNFHAGDSHVVLLDVVAERPGPVADVGVIYKDVVYLRNGTARSHLVLASGNRAPGPLEHNVLKNLLAWRLATTTRQAAQHLALGRQGRATALLDSLRTLLRGLRHEIPGWSADEEILNDEGMLAEYIHLLGSPSAREAGQRRRLADSLRYAGFRRLARVSGEPVQ